MTQSTAYINIGTAFTSLTITNGESSTFHEQCTPVAISIAKKRVIRFADEERWSVELDRYLRCLWMSFHLQEIRYVVFVRDITDMNEFVLYVLKWIHAFKGACSTVSTVSFPLFSAALSGVGQHSVVVDLGASCTRLTAVHFSLVVSEAAVYTVGVGTVAQRALSKTCHPASLSADWNEGMAFLLDAYIHACYMEEKKAKKEIARDSAFVESQGGSEELPYALLSSSHHTVVPIDEFTTGLDNAIDFFIQNIRSKGMGVVLHSWIITGGGRNIPSVVDYVGFLLSKKIPDASLIIV